VNLNLGAPAGAIAAAIAFQQAQRNLAPYIASGVFAGSHALPLTQALTLNPNPDLLAGLNALKDVGCGGGVVQGPQTGSHGTGLPPGVFPENAGSVTYTDGSGQVYSDTIGSCSQINFNSLSIKANHQIEGLKRLCVKENIKNPMLQGTRIPAQSPTASKDIKKDPVW
jgi:hypothetical protein